jgi:sulfur transfer complex TusBCD TusB component (DsrH family)
VGIVMAKTNDGRSLEDLHKYCHFREGLLLWNFGVSLLVKGSRFWNLFISQGTSIEMYILGTLSGRME